MKKIAAIILIMMLTMFLGVIQAPPVAAKVISATASVHDLEVDEDGNLIGGYWLLSFTVDDDDIIFTSQPVETVDASEIKGLAGGGKVTVSAEHAIRVRLTAGDAFTTGPVETFYYNYYTGSRDESDMRSWAFYGLAYPDWHPDGTHVSYHAAITDVTSGTTLVDEDFLIGATEHDVGRASYTFDGTTITINNLGGIWNGWTPPSADKAYMWWSEAKTGYTTRSIIMSKLPSSGKMPTGYVRINKFTTVKVEKWEQPYWKEVDLYEDSYIEDTYMYLHWNTGGWWQDRKVRIYETGPYDDDVINYGVITWREGYSKNCRVVFSLTTKQDDAKIVPNQSKVISTWTPAGQPVPVIFLGETSDIFQGEFEYRFYFTNHDCDKDLSGSVKIRMFEKTTSWNRFVERMSLSGEQPLNFDFVTSAEVPAAAPWEPIFSPSAYSLYTTETYPAKSSSERYTHELLVDDTGKPVTAVIRAVPGTLNALVTLKVPVEYFKTIISIPGNGTPEIVNKENLELDLYAGADNKLDVQIKNTGPWHDIFRVKSVEVPGGVSVVGGGGSIPIDKDETKTLTLTFHSGYQPDDFDTTTKMVVEALGSGKTDEATITWHIHAGGVPPETRADLTVIVRDKETELPLSGARVMVDGQGQQTNSSGTVVFSNLLTRSYTIEVTKEGYESQTRDIVLTSAGYTAVFYLSKAKADTTTLIVAGGAVAALAGVAALLLAKRRLTGAHYRYEEEL